MTYAAPTAYAASAATPVISSISAAAPTYATAAAPMTYAASTTYAAPAATYAASAPMTYAAAPTTYASAATYAAPAMSAFNMLDRNHDGVITRAEFEQFGF